MISEKTETLLVTDRRSFQYPKVSAKTYRSPLIKSSNVDLARLMPNISGPREAKRRLVAIVVHLKLLYTALVWASALNNHAIQKKIFAAQRRVALRIVSTY